MEFLRLLLRRCFVGAQVVTSQKHWLFSQAKKKGFWRCSVE